MTPANTSGTATAIGTIGTPRPELLSVADVGAAEVNVVEGIVAVLETERYCKLTTTVKHCNTWWWLSTHYIITGWEPLQLR